MAVNRLQYGRELEKQLGGGKPLRKAHKTAAKKTKVRQKKYDGEALVKKVTKMLKMIYYGKEYHRKK